jgi:hypothetical protein
MDVQFPRISVGVDHERDEQRHIRERKRDLAGLR